MDDDTFGNDKIQQAINDIRNRISAIEARLSRLEKAFSIEAPSPPSIESGQADVAESERGTERSAGISLEQRIGEYWFAQLGIVVLLIGLFFLITYVFTEFGPFWQTVIGYGITVLVYSLSRLKQERYKLISNSLLPGSFLLLYFVTLRMHFFQENPIITGKSAALVILLIVLGLQFYIAWRSRSQWLMFIPILLGYLTALLSDTHHFALVTIFITALMAALLLSIYHWHYLGLSSIVLSYSAFLLYLLNNPLIGGQIQILPEHDWILVYLVITLIVYTLVSFRPGVNQYLNPPTRILLTTLNSIGFYLVAFLVTFQFFEEQIAMWNFIFTGILLAIAIAHWTIRHSKYSTSFYASFSFIALTVGILSATSPPQVYLWLAWQSALVIGTALWFHSSIIGWANTGIYTLVFLIYLIFGDHTGLVNFNFVLVAIISERLLDYSHKRIKGIPRFFQVIYLLTGYVMFVYGLSIVLPASYISVSWLIVSSVYFISGYYLNLSFYRLMGAGSFLLTVGRVFIVDLASLELIYRVLSFVLVGLGLIIVGILYNRKKFLSRT